MLTQTDARLELERAIMRLPASGPDWKGRGIVIPGGGRYLACGWVCINMLRHLGCRLPIEFWHLGPQEVRPQFIEAAAALGVKCVDALKVRERRPARRLHGWELKPYAALHSDFEEVLLLDADNVPVVDPSFLFDTPEYLRDGAVFWPDRGRMGPDHAAWKLTGVDHRDEPEFESGQLLIHKNRCLRELHLTMWFNEQSDFWYHVVYGDKETFHLAWRKLARPYAMPPYPVHELYGVMCQHDFQGRRIFQHRGGDKWSLEGRNLRISGFRYENICLDFLRQFGRLLGGGPFETPAPMEAARPVRPARPAGPRGDCCGQRKASPPHSELQPVSAPGPLPEAWAIAPRAQMIEQTITPPPIVGPAMRIVNPDS